MSQAEKDMWKIELKLKKGSHLLKFIVNGSDSISDYMEKAFVDGRTYNIFQYKQGTFNTLHDKKYPDVCITLLYT